MKTNSENRHCASFVVTKCKAQRISRGKKRHPENSKCEENKNNGTRVIIQELNEQTMCQLGPSTRYKRHSDITFFRQLNYSICEYHLWRKK
ncbi:hypothetical protein PR048_024633 [Dryococelus australis]|uniref:Uncharacterized protein n=1 Tax=Dryococelus australis TaxID=614101 RepID=A0ABQ9GP41_9NEOP|nr:hypothetical protein PR048_024633 [Dryococelus australis]